MMAEQVMFGGSLLGTVTQGIYHNPLDIISEWIQNAVDAYDCCDDFKRKDLGIDLVIEPHSKQVMCADYATGISAQDFEQVMRSLGISNKPFEKNIQRGFRGIGRLSGLGVAKTLRFMTRSSADSLVSVCTWDGQKFSKVIGQQYGTLQMAIDALIDFETTDIDALINTFSPFARDLVANKLDDAFFIVALGGVSRMHHPTLANPSRVQSHIGQMCPVAFHHDFRFGEKIDDISGRPPTYPIRVNSVQVTRPHRDVLYYRDKQVSVIKDVHAFQGDHLARERDFGGWWADHDFMGAIPPSTGVSGLRVRQNNIQIGNNKVFEDLFTEARFNQWSIGEVHVAANLLRPNARRDGFEHSPLLESLKLGLHNAIQDISTAIRKASKTRAPKQKPFALEREWDKLPPTLRHEILEYLQKENIAYVSSHALHFKIVPSAPQSSLVGGAHAGATNDERSQTSFYQPKIS